MQNPASRIVSFVSTGPEWIDVGGGIGCTTLFAGDANSPDSPAFQIVRADGNVGDKIFGRAVHETPCMTIVIEGTLQLDGRWMTSGEIQLAPEGVWHGDLVIGPNGAVFAEMFAQRAGMIPRFEDQEDQTLFDAAFRDSAEQIGRGSKEFPIVLHGPRRSYRPRRGIIVIDPAKSPA